jgi:3-methyladenine DNA glycosylase AlkD
VTTFFKTGKGEYAEHDKFLGTMNAAQMRARAKEQRDLPLPKVLKLLRSPYNEERCIALLMLIGRPEAVRVYLDNTKYVNNWNLVDASAPYILGASLVEKRDRRVLYKLAKSKDLWERRIAIVSTQALIRDGQFDDTLKLCELLIDDEHDLIHKACGWMLREVGKRNRKTLDQFLKKHARELPRTALRYAIERHSPAERKRWMLEGR